MVSQPQYWKLLNWQNTVFASIKGTAATTILLALMLDVFAMFASLIRLLCWRWAGEKENRLKVFTAAAMLGNAALVVVIFALVFRRTCTSPKICSGEAYHGVARRSQVWSKPIFIGSWGAN